MYSLLVYSECSSVSRGGAVSCSHQWTVPVQICLEIFLFFSHLLHHCKGDSSDSYDFINLVMCFC